MEVLFPSGLRVVRVEMPTPFAVGSVNAFLLRKEDVAVLVDCGPKYEPARDALRAALAREGLTPKDITALVLTHGHVDHVGLASEFQTQGVPILAHPYVHTWLAPGSEWDDYRLAFFNKLYRVMGVPQADASRAIQEILSYHQWNDQSVVDQSLRHGQRLDALPEFQVIYVPGHAQAAIGLWNPQERLFVAGDQLLRHVSSNALIEPRLNAVDGNAAERTFSLLDYRRSLRELSMLPMAQVFPGHGAPFADARELIAQRLVEQHQRRGQILALLEACGPASAFEIAVRYFPRHVDQLPLILSEVLGHLDWLYLEGAVEVEVDRLGVAQWRVSTAAPALVQIG